MKKDNEEDIKYKDTNLHFGKPSFNGGITTD
jgi:hypothetical protein